MESLLNRMSVDVYQTLINNNPDPIFLFDQEGTVLHINSAAHAIFGYSLDEYRSINYLEILAPDQLQDAGSMFQKVFQGKSCSYQATATTKDGRVLHLEVKNVPLLDNGELIGVMIVAKDVTDFHQTRIALQEASERLRSLYESSGDAIDIIDLKGNVLSVNYAFEDMYGWKLEEIVGKPMPTIPEDRMHDVNKRRENARAGQNIKGFEVTCLKKDGSSIEVSITLSSIYDERGNVVAYSGITRDISERKRLEAELRESKNRYASLLHASPEPIYVQSKGIIRYINDIGSQMFGYNEPRELLGKPILDFVHDDSKSIAIERIHCSLNEAVLPKEKVEQRMLRKDGSSFVMEGTALGIEYEGEPAVQVIFRDVSEKKEIENALIRSEEKYRLIADNMTDLVAIIDENGFINYASPSSFTVLGNTSEYYEKKSAFDFVHQEDLPKVLEMFNSVFVSKESIVMEFRVKHKTKSWIWIESKGSFFIDEEHGKPFLLFVAYSIGKRKALQEKMELMAFHDELTGLPNRRLFQQNMSQTLTEAKRHHRTFALLYMDIDKFKWVNDQLGHSTGDELLIQFGERVLSCLRESDILARQGGDEFTVLLTDIENEVNAHTCAERIIASLQPEWRIGEHNFNTTSSIGIAIYPKDGMTVDELMTNADRALYEAKECGRNTYRTYS